MGAPNGPLSFPRLTWVQCDCGCGWEGADEVAEWLIGEAILVRQRVLESREADVVQDDAERDYRLRSLAAGMLGGR